MASHATEVEAYGYIRDRLKESGWVVRNPSLRTGGQVWTQNQCLSHPTMKQAFGTNRPENVVKVSERHLWVIEGKAARKDVGRAVEEALHYYADAINALNSDVVATLASGVAGDEASGYMIRTFILLDGRWQPVTINGQEATGLLGPRDVQFLLEHGTSDIHEFSPPPRLFLQAAERINKELHLGGINKNDRAKTMAALLLAVVEGAPNLDTDLPVLIRDINSRSSNILRKHDKPDFAPFVHLLPPTNASNHPKFKAALVNTIQVLLNLNIRSAMNSSTDVLGQFYEVFLKYGNGAKEIGVVLTPRHITRFAVDVLGVNYNDVVLDPACGTGGFLVAAFDYVRRFSTGRQLDRFKQFNLFGIEQESYIAALAIVNMIFRGDGKNGITEGNCFYTNLTAATVEGAPSATYTADPPARGMEPVTRVFMNPPFALQGSTDQEYSFVSRALDMMADGGLLFSLLPLDCLFGAHAAKVWREQELLRNNTLLAVVTLPHELFYPAALKQVAGIIVRKGFSHPREQPVFWARVAFDGHVKVKSKRLPASSLEPPRTAEDDIPHVRGPLRRHVANPGSVAVNEPMLCKTAPIDFSDPLLELVPEAYLDSKAPTSEELKSSVDQMARDTAAFLVRFAKESKAEEYR